MNKRNSLSDRTNWKLLLLLDRLEDHLEDQSNSAHHYINRLYNLTNYKNPKSSVFVLSVWWDMTDFMNWLEPMWGRVAPLRGTWGRSLKVEPSPDITFNILNLYLYIVASAT